MDRTIGHMRYTSRRVKDNLDGYGGYELLRSRDDTEPVRVASVIYWDAAPGYPRRLVFARRSGVECNRRSVIPAPVPCVALPHYEGDSSLSCYQEVG